MTATRPVPAPDIAAVASRILPAEAPSARAAAPATQPATDAHNPCTQDSDHAPRRHTQKFTASRDQVREARRFLTVLLDGCPAINDAVLILSELASNCVVHSASAARTGKFTITAEVREGQYVRIEARDDGGTWNQRKHHDDRPHGLDIVARLATGHGISGDPLTGWTAWAVIGWHGAPAPGTTNGHPDDYYDLETSPPQASTLPRRPPARPPAMTAHRPAADQPSRCRSAP